jgi:hypothetical protein
VDLVPQSLIYCLVGFTESFLGFCGETAVGVTLDAGSYRLERR